MVRLTLIQGDALKILKHLPSESVDLVLTDPPYGISSEVVITRERNPMKFGKYRGKDIILNFGEWDNFDSDEKYWEFTYSWVDEIIRVLREGGMFCTFFDRDKINFVSKYLQDREFKPKGYFAFIKSNPVPQARKVKWMNAWEIIGMWQKKGGKLTYNYQLGQHPDYIMTSICQGKERTEHPTQKPIKIARLFIKYWSNSDDTILDPFLGSGTTMKACLELNRNCIGIEISEDYCENIIIPRLKPLITQTTLTNIQHNFEYLKFNESKNRLEKILEISNFRRD